MNKYFAELVGTFVLVSGGVGSAVLAGSHIGFVGIALAFGLSLLAMVYTIGPISGCHVNPAVTPGVFLPGRSRPKTLPHTWSRRSSERSSPLRLSCSLQMAHRWAMTLP